MMIEYPCGRPDCIFCAIHCPYCGQWPIVLEVEDRRMCCPTCGRTEDLVHPKMIVMRHRQVLALTGRSIPEWKAKARQLSPRLRHRWRSALNYLDPATSAALSRMDDLYCVYGDAHMFPAEDELYVLRGKAARRLFQRLLEANPALSSADGGDLAYVDDWY
jgi:ribosomal protein S27E